MIDIPNASHLNQMTVQNTPL